MTDFYHGQNKKKLGAINAMQDAIILANCLYDPKSRLKDISVAFQSYHDQRFDKAKEQYDHSLLAEKIYSGQVCLILGLQTNSAYWYLSRVLYASLCCFNSQSTHRDGMKRLSDRLSLVSYLNGSNKKRSRSYTRIDLKLPSCPWFLSEVLVMSSLGCLLRDIREGWQR